MSDRSERIVLASLVAICVVILAVVVLVVVNDRADRDRCEHSTCDAGTPVYLRAHGRMICGCVVAPWSKQ